jgi:hypothetical protein
MDMILLHSIVACPTASPLLPEPRRDGGISPIRLFLASAGAATAAGPGDGVPRPDLDGRDRLPVPVSAVQTENRRDAFTAGRHAHKSPSSGFLPMPGPDDSRGLHPAKRLEDLTKIIPRHTPGQIPYIDVHSLSLS